MKTTHTTIASRGFVRTAVTTLAIVIMTLFSAAAHGQAEKQSFIERHHIAGYVGMSGRGTTVFSDATGFADLRAAITIGHKWAIGLTGSALLHDNQLSALVDDGTYHLYAAYSGIFVERIFLLNNDFAISLGLMSGQGEASYRYDKEYRKEKVWKDEVIDKVTFGVQELTLDIQHRLRGNLWLGVTGSLRNTSPLKLIGTPDDLLEKAGAGVTLKYVIG